MPTPAGSQRSPADLAAEQGRRERVEGELAAEAAEDGDARGHERRAEKAAYLREKLEDQVESERQGDA